ncbi:hypothetical protein LTR56_009851 [Elasticomyces elasticus]|nr:hypothetical protein LTR56_009851 [Elasticomyces elasticus]KAK3659167.1 hypothetical protein LTR22_008630 [Elasticomyces elasticus]KAK4923156.1 hypothetical protein LTR49_009624 [Elasticomyces elasticus]KAK5761541.1 hypothetical protein LTS12_008333 [Elasticomyces elasticus]
MSQPEGTSGQHFNSGDTLLWPAQNAAPLNNNALQPDLSSSLLWPDSEDLFLSLTDGGLWDHSMPGLISLERLPHGGPQAIPAPPVVVGLSPYDEPTVTEDGRRAVQTTNGLLTNTLLSVTSNAALFDLTPRFLDSSLHTFFTKFLPILPIIHRPTFVYRECSAPLLLNAISLGSLFIGTQDASETNRILRMTSQTFYGLSMHWAQYCGLYDVGRAATPEIPQVDNSVETKMRAWRTWAARETQLRALLGLCVIDGVVSQFSGNFVNTWAATNSLPLAADDQAFEASNVDEWLAVMRENSSSQRSASTRFYDVYHSLLVDESESGLVKSLSGLLNIKILLEILASLAADFERVTPGPTGLRCKVGATKALGRLRKILSQSTILSTADKTIGLLRWHAVCLNLVCSTARGARRMCHYYGITQHIFGGKKRQEPGPVDPERWAQGLSARKSLLHASEIHRIASEIPLGVMHDTCLPGALFAAATTYASFALPGLTKVFLPVAIDWDTVILSGLDDDENQMPTSPVSNEARQNTLRFLESSIDMPSPNWTARNLFYELNAIRVLLHSLSQNWGVTQEMEEVVGSWEARCT